jgi:putative ABC transport system permease protein
VTIPRLDGAAADPWLFGVAAALSIGSLLTCAVIPALLSSRIKVEATLREARQTAPRGALRVREWLMAVEVAAALLIVAGGGLMFRTVEHLMRVDPGFKPDGVLTAGLSLVGPRWAEDRDVRAFQTELLRRVQALPGVESAALAGQIPLGGNQDTWGFGVVGRNVLKADSPSAERYSVTADYFRLMGIPLKQGRWLTSQDRFENEKVILIGETTAHTIWPGESPIGKQVRFGSEERPRVMTVVGVVGDVRHYSLADAPTAQFYSTQEQITDSYLTLLVRSAHPEQLTDAIRREVTALAPDVPLYSISRFEALVSSSIATRSFLMVLLAGLGAITLILAGIGLYGVVSQSVAVRRRELGIRVALGASRGSVLALMARRGVAVFAAGALAGLAAAAGAGYLIKSQLFETRPMDPLTFAASAGALALVTAVAHLAPLRRALRTNPTETLRGD